MKETIKKIILKNKSFSILIIGILILTLSFFSIKVKCTLYDVGGIVIINTKHQKEFKTCKIPLNVFHTIGITLGIGIILYEIKKGNKPTH